MDKKFENGLAGTELFNKPCEKITELGHYVVHKDYRLVDDFTDEPLAKGFIQNIGNIDDFISFVKEYETAETKIFYDEKKVHAYFDYHRKDKDSKNNRLAILPFSETKEFFELQKILCSSVTQKGLVIFLKKIERFIRKDDKVNDVSLFSYFETMRTIRNVDQAVRNEGDKVSLELKTENSVKKAELFTNITLTMPVYKCSDDTVDFNCEIFYGQDTNTGALQITLECYDIDNIVEDFRRGLVAKVSESCKSKFYKSA